MHRHPLLRRNGAFQITASPATGLTGDDEVGVDHPRDEVVVRRNLAAQVPGQGRGHLAQVHLRLVRALQLQEEKEGGQAVSAIAQRIGRTERYTFFYRWQKKQNEVTSSRAGSERTRLSRGSNGIQADSSSLASRTLAVQRRAEPLTNQRSGLAPHEKFTADCHALIH